MNKYSTNATKPESVYEIGNAKYHVNREFSGAETMKRLLAEYIVKLKAQNQG